NAGTPCRSWMSLASSRSGDTRPAWACPHDHRAAASSRPPFGEGRPARAAPPPRALLARSNRRNERAVRRAAPGYVVVTRSSGQRERDVHAANGVQDSGRAVLAVEVI